MREVPGQPAPADRADPADPAFEQLLIFLKDSRGFDFTGYKRASLMRRVRHQMRQVGLASFEDYLDHLQVHPDEFATMFDTILINVTGFFRDIASWRHLEQVLIPDLLARTEHRDVRVWSAGCSSGEEAYSLAIVFAEILGLDQFRERVKIYATDIDEDALSVARQAVYSERALRDVSEERRVRYFEAQGNRFAFRKDLRRSVIFGRNDLIQDAPISRIDLLSCRNTLMYFNSETQGRIAGRLAFALRPGGLLFLGKAEMLLSHSPLFEPIDLKRRFFRKTPAAAGAEADPRGHDRTMTPAATDDPTSQLRAEAFLASPVAQLVVGDDGRVVLVNHRATSLLNVSERDIGLPFHELEISYRPAELRSHLAAVKQSNQPAWIRDVHWRRTPDETVFLDIQLVPLTEGGARLGIALMFNDVTRYRQLQRELEAANRQLETAYEELQSTNEELETTNEELQSTVEELETTNEELQSTNEELETMNEELQSMNDELQVTNETLRERTTQISSLNAFMESVLASLGAAVVVVNRDLIVDVWSGQAEDLWGVREAEAVGTHLFNLDSGLPAEQLKHPIRAVLDGSPREELTVETTNRRGRRIGVRTTVTPLVAGDRLAGALLLLEPTDLP